MRLWAVGTASPFGAPILGRITTRPIGQHRADHIFYATDDAGWISDEDLTGYAGLLSRQPSTATQIPAINLGSNASLDYLGDGDVVRMAPDGSVHVLFRKASQNNTILTTERCNSLCLMCSQPPKEADDSYRVGMILRLVELIDPGARELVISGGEPGLLGEGLISVLDKCRLLLPETALHVLTNGRLFKQRTFAAKVAAVRHPDLMLGIPLYSDIDTRHDYVVQARGAFDETMEGLYNLARLGVPIEIRVVLHQQTYKRLPHLAEFIARNLPFVSHIALMGLEMFGLTARNLGVLWVDPVDYGRQLEEATLALALRGMKVSIYNHQLCTIPRSLWPFARKSISDWKNVYLEECGNCKAQPFCGGFFQSATKRHSAHIRSVTHLSTTATSYLRDLHRLPEASTQAS